MKLKITGGIHKGRMIDAPKGNQTRPTSEKLRKTFFDICQMRIEDSFVLDLFSGSGAIGLEALSRGCTESYLVESDSKAQFTIDNNIKLLSYQKSAHLLKMDVLKALARLKEAGIVFDLIFMDPPYATNKEAKGLAEQVLEKIEDLNLLKDDGMILLEEGRHFNLERCIDGLKTLELFNQRKAGDTQIFQFVKK